MSHTLVLIAVVVVLLVIVFVVYKKSKSRPAGSGITTTNISDASTTATWIPTPGYLIVTNLTECNIGSDGSIGCKGTLIPPNGTTTGLGTLSGCTFTLYTAAVGAITGTLSGEPNTSHIVPTDSTTPIVGYFVSDSKAASASQIKAIVQSGQTNGPIPISSSDAMVITLCNLPTTS